MANLNVSNRMVQVLGNQDAQNLVNKILNDGKVDKTDKQDLQALEAMLKSAAEEGDGKVDGEEKELIGALTNHSYVLGVNTGTSEEILLDNLKKVQQIQSKFKNMQPSEVAFDGLAITTDGFFSDEVRVVRLRDQIEAPTTQGEETQPAPTGTQTGATTGTTTPTETPSEGETVNETPDTADTPPAEEIDPIVPKTQYTPTTAPTAGTPSVEVPPEQAARVALQEQAYTEAVQELQTEVRAVREMLNDPSQVSNEQLQSSLQSFAESDPTKALKEIKRHNDKILEDMKAAGVITDVDIAEIGNAQSLTNHKLTNGEKFGNVLAKYLNDTPLSEKQLNGYRETLVKAADNYLAEPNDANKETLRTELYDNLYVFEKGATPAQEEAYRKLSPALDQVDQKQSAFEKQLAVATDKASVLSPDITSADGLAKALQNAKTAPQSQIDTFAGQMDNVLTYLNENPDQYEGQAGDATALKSKVEELKSTQDPERKLALFNELKTDLDEIYIKTDIQKGANGVSQATTMAQLESLKANASDPKVAEAADFLMKNPELLSQLPNVSEYKTILDSFNNGPQKLTPKQEELKAALEAGDTAKVNQMYMSEMFNNVGGFMSSLGSYFGWGASTPNSAENQEAALPGTWLGASSLAETLQAASPERRAELMVALQSPEAAQLSQALQSSPELSQIMGRYENAKAAKSSIEAAHWSNNSTLEQTQEALQNQQSQPTAIQTELENAQSAIDNLLQDGDLAPPVAERLKTQKESLDKALAMIKAGTFTTEVANSPEMAGLTEILQANATRTNTTPLLSIEQALKKDATIHALESLKTDKESLAKLESALSHLKDENGKPMYGNTFEKDENGEYKFPDQMIALINDPELNSGGLALALHQVNRSLHVIDSAKTRSVETLKANYEQGKKLKQEGSGERDFFSGYMALKGLSSISSSAQDMGFKSSTELLNVVSQNGMEELLEDKSLNKADKREQISQLMVKNLEQANQNLVGKVSEEKLNAVRENFKDIFDSDDPIKQAAKEQLLAAAAKINPNINPAEITSSEQLLDSLNQEQITSLQNEIRNNAGASTISTYPPEVQALLEKLSPEVRAQYYPGMDSSELGHQDKSLVDTINKSLSSEAIADIEKKQRTNQLLMGAVSQLDPLAEFRSAQSNLTGRLNGALNIMQSVQTEARNKLEGIAPDANSHIFGDLTPPRPGTDNYLDNLQSYNNQILTNSQAYLKSDAFKQLPADKQIEVRAFVESIKTSASSSMTQIPLLHKVKSGKGLSDTERSNAELALGLAITYRNGARRIGQAAENGNTNDIAKEQQNLSNNVNLVTQTAQTGDYSNIPDPQTNPDANEALGQMNGLNTGAQNWNAVQGAMQEQVSQGNISPHQLLSEDYQKYSLDHGGTPDSPVYPNDPEPTLSQEDLLESFSGMQELLVESPPEVAAQAAQTLLPLLELQVHSWDEAIESFDDFTLAMNPVMQQMGYPPLDTSTIDNPPASSLSKAAGPPPQTAADQKAAELVDKANALADRLVLAPEGENSEEFLMDLINGFIDTIRDQDYKTRQLILAQLANQMMTDSITNFYKDKTDKNNKYHQDSISRMAESFQRNIQRTIQESLVSQASDGQSIAAVSGQVGAANTAQAMGLEQLRASSEQLLSEAQKMTPPLITDLQKEKILESLFDNNPNNDAMGIIALAGLSIN